MVHLLFIIIIERHQEGSANWNYKDSANWNYKTLGIIWLFCKGGGTCNTGGAMLLKFFVMVYWFGVKSKLGF